MKTEHSIFIPSSLMVDKAAETEEFVKVARYINKQVIWNCPVTPEPKTTKRISGIEFVFEFSSETEYDKIIEHLNARLNQ